MFFYVSLFVACVFLAFVVIYIINALTAVGSGLYRAFLPSAKKGTAGRHERVYSRTTRNSAQTPWGWKGNNNVIREHGSRHATAYATSGLDDLIRDHGSRSSSAGWPHREEKADLTGKSYKVSRQSGASRSGRSKPWGW